MESTRKERENNCKPVIFIIGTYVVTWCCIFALESLNIFGYQMPGLLIWLFDFIKSASPLLVALFLLRKQLRDKGFLAGYILGERKGAVTYAVTALIFILYFFFAFFFRSAEAVLSVPVFFAEFIGMLLFGGGLEEGGWRGYLFPALKIKMPVLAAVTAVSVIWGLWHLPYFLIPTSAQYGSSILGYLLLAIMLGFLLTAIYMLTKSVLLCTLFHAFNNAVSTIFQMDAGNKACMAALIVLCAGGAVICCICAAQEKKTRNYSEEH